jgi:hypothetical protein
VVVVFDTHSQLIVSQYAFDDADEAEAAFSHAEREHRGKDDGIEVVMLTAASPASLRITHPHYFAGEARAEDRSGETAEFLIPARREG